MLVLGAVYVKLVGLVIPSKTSLAKEPVEPSPTHNATLDFPLSEHYKFYNPPSKQSPIEYKTKAGQNNASYIRSTKFLQLLPLTACTQIYSK